MKIIKKIIVLIINYIKKQYQKSIEVLKMFDEEITRTKKFVDALKVAIKYQLRITKLWILPTIVFALFVKLLLIIKLYLVYVLAAVFGVWWIIDYIKNIDYQQMFVANQTTQDSYDFVGGFIFDSLRNLADCLPVKMPQDVQSINHYPILQDYGHYKVYCYKLIKKSSDKIAPEKIEFSEKVLKSLITDELNRYEQLHKNDLTYVGDLRRIELDSLNDVGDIVLLKIAFMNNQNIYNYILNKAKSVILPNQSTIPTDKDF